MFIFSCRNGRDNVDLLNSASQLSGVNMVMRGAL